MNSLASGVLLVDVPGHTLTREDREILSHPLVAGVILFSRNHGSLRQLEELVGQIRALRDPPLLVTVDQEGGRVQRFRNGFTPLPPAGIFGEIHDRDPTKARAMARAAGWIMAAELAAMRVDLSFAPVVDLNRGKGTVIGNRAFHSDPKIVTELAGAFAGGMKEAGMAGSIKHFPGHGGVAGDSHEELPVDERTLGAIEGADLVPFRALMRQGMAAVMMAHVRYERVADAPASLSKVWIRDILRGRFGFNGVVFCDDLSMNGAARAGDYPERAMAALQAGCDILPVCNNRPGVEACLDALPSVSGVDCADPSTLLRIRTSPDRSALRRSERWCRAHRNMRTLVT